MSLLVKIIVAGGFGVDVGHRLAALLRDERHDVDLHRLDAGPPAGLTDADIAVLVAARDDTVVAELAWAAGVPRLPVIHSHPDIRVGPVDLPGRGPCSRCHASRLAQHGPQGTDTPTGPAPLPPHLVELAAGTALGATTTGEVRTGRVLLIDTWTDRVTSAPVVPVHGCPRCGGPAPRDRRAALRSTARRSIDA